MTRRVLPSPFLAHRRELRALEDVLPRVEFQQAMRQRGYSSPRHPDTATQDALRELCPSLEYRARGTHVHCSFFPAWCYFFSYASICHPILLREKKSPTWPMRIMRWVESEPALALERSRQLASLHAMLSPDGEDNIGSSWAPFIAFYQDATRDAQKP